MWRILILVTFSLGVWAQESHPILAPGSPAPNFELPGVDGKTHKLADYAASPVLVVVFACNHCPISQMYEAVSRNSPRTTRTAA
jgi:peroxiredoxin